MKRERERKEGQKEKEREMKRGYPGPDDLSRLDYICKMCVCQNICVCLCEYICVCVCEYVCVSICVYKYVYDVILAICLSETPILTALLMQTEVS